MGYEQKIARQEAPLVVNKEGKLVISTSEAKQEKKDIPPQKTQQEIKEEIQQTILAQEKLKHAQLYGIPEEAIADDVSLGHNDVTALKNELKILEQSKRKGLLKKFFSLFSSEHNQ